MKEVPLTNCERNFINKCIEEETRLDGRKLLEPRPVKLYFGSSWGCCMVSLGHTRAVVQISCDIQQPKTSRPNEGTIRINVELTPLAAQHFESGRQSEAAILISRQLEKCFKDSKCIDLESLCIVADKKIWNLRIDVNIINHDGNLVDCASIATLAALMHFHRPDVTSTGKEIIVHPASEKDFLPLTLFHYPICVSFITFKSGHTIMDPTYNEERVGVAELTLGMNSYRELCSLHFDYLTKTMTIEDVISVVSNDAANYATKLVQQIKEAVIKDVQSRYKKDDSNVSRFKESIQVNKLTTTIGDHISIKLHKWNATTVENDFMETESEDKSYIINCEEGSADLIPVFDESVKEETLSIYESDSDNEILIKSPSPEKEK
ncbi:exosome complex component rrp45 isoform X1 [Pogonomyrmex barbatus]|uniref:Exosome complex component RRP45 n=1 Tax=Pogonomyrmex barbatus TaxID=144034 RepID=A0A6I9XKV6_9HYME|nr:exosome complex component rrp45 isoform X1 [Pogonomyrmex barbatus]XP_011646484.1 exosome complex component rrp45 isoform X1 [Pogonomyrmex barbatus]XP_011646485.1 exosome complex component rrp45 isoform X1 [Pogonomyrmex barbatus]